MQKRSVATWTPDCTKSLNERAKRAFDAIVSAADEDAAELAFERFMDSLDRLLVNTTLSQGKYQRVSGYVADAFAKRAA